MAERFIEFVLIKNYTSFRPICSDVHIIIHGNPVTVFTRIMNTFSKKIFRYTLIYFKTAMQNFSKIKPNLFIILNFLLCKGFSFNK